MVEFALQETHNLLVYSVHFCSSLTKYLHSTSHSPVALDGRSIHSQARALIFLRTTYRRSTQAVHYLSFPNHNFRQKWISILLFNTHNWKKKQLIIFGNFKFTVAIVNLLICLEQMKYQIVIFKLKLLILFMFHKRLSNNIFQALLIYSCLL